MRNTIKVDSKIDLTRIRHIGDKLRDLMMELSIIFPERQTLLAQLQFALLTREHVLVFGTYGTGKSDLLNTLVRAITGANLFSIGLNRFMSESALLGVANPREMRENGNIVYDPKNGILSAHFAELDEIFDANPYLLRSLLGILNERQWKRGNVSYDAELFTAIASTNGVPVKEIDRAPELAALVDRFLFQCQVKYLTEEESRRAMYKKYTQGMKPETVITLDELKYISEVVVGANQITSEYFIEVYDRVIQAYRAAIGDQSVISDRRACKLIQLVEANALLFGRYEVAFEDILAIRHGLCHGNAEWIKRFNETAQPIIDEANAKAPLDIDAQELQLIDLFSQKIPAIPASPTGEQLVNIKRELLSLGQEVRKVSPKLSSTEDKKTALLLKIEATIQRVQLIIDTPPAPAATNVAAGTNP